MISTICSIPVDWDATGSFLSGTAGWAGIGALVWATLKGRQTFQDYRAAKATDKQVEAAERVLTAAYAARSAISDVRSPLIEIAEQQRAERKLDESADGFRDLPSSKKAKYARAQLYLDRLNSVRPQFAAVWDVLPIARAHFGEDVQKALEDIAHQRRVIQVAAEELAEDDQKDREFTRSLHADLSRAGRPDKLGAHVDERVAQLESRLLPILRTEREPR